MRGAADGTLHFDEVSFLSLADPGVAAPFVRLTAQGGRALTLTPTHHVSVGPACCATVVQAKDLRVNDTVWLAPPPAADDAGAIGAAAEGGVRPARVVAVESTAGVGLHNPLLTRGGYPVVDGFVTASNCPHAHGRAAAWAPLLGWACGLTGTCASATRLVSHVECAKLRLEHRVWGQTWRECRWQPTPEAPECPPMRSHIRQRQDERDEM